MRFGAYGHLLDKLEFIENGVLMLLLLCLGVGGFTGLIRGRVLTIFLWAFYNFLLIVISINIVLALVSSFPTNLVSLNSESVCRSCVSFGVLKKAAAVLPLMGAVLPLGGDVIFYYCSWERYYRLEQYYLG